MCTTHSIRPDKRQLHTPSGYRRSLLGRIDINDRNYKTFFYRTERRQEVHLWEEEEEAEVRTTAITAVIAAAEDTARIQAAAIAAAVTAAITAVIITTIIITTTDITAGDIMAEDITDAGAIRSVR